MPLFWAILGLESKIRILQIIFSFEKKTCEKKRKVAECRSISPKPTDESCKRKEHSQKPKGNDELSQKNNFHN